MKRFCCGLGTVFLLLSLTGRTRAEYVFTPLDSINPSADRAAPYGINNLGQIVGGDSNTFGGFLLSGTSYVSIGPPAIASQALGINDRGDIVGNFVLARAQSHGFLYSGGSYTLVDVPFPGQQTAPHGINNAGEVVGYYLSGLGPPYKGFLLDGGTYTSLIVPGADYLTDPYKVNDSGQIVGIYAQGLGAGYHGFLLSDGSYTLLDVPSATETIVSGINNRGQIVGYYTAGGSQHGFLLSGGSYGTVDVPGATLTEIWDINDAGQLVENYLDAAGTFHGFVATPTPEPATLFAS
jgi:probable HAF family extracellular repeat protein